MLKRFIIAIVALVIVCGGIVGYFFFNVSRMIAQFQNAPAPVVKVSTVEVKPISWTPGVEAVGTISAARGVDLTVETAGIVQELHFSANQRVEAGAILVQLEDKVQRADLEAARAQAELDRQALERATQLQQRGVTTTVNLDNAKTAFATSTAQVNKLAAIVDQKQVRSPFSGTIGIPRVEKGQYLTPGTIVATLQDLDTMRADFKVPEQQLSLLKSGYEVAFGPADGVTPIRGKITGIDPKVDPQTRLGAVRAEIANAEGRLTPGQFVEVRVELPKEDGVLAVPQTALVSSLYGDYVYVVRPAETPAGDKASATTPTAGAGATAAESSEQKPRLAAYQVFVTAGRRDAGYAEITRGLNAGDIVVNAGQNRLTKGTLVDIDNSAAPSAAAPGTPAR